MVASCMGPAPHCPSNQHTHRSLQAVQVPNRAQVMITLGSPRLYLLAHHVFMANGNWLASEGKLTRELHPALVTQSKEASTEGRTKSCCFAPDLRYPFTWLSLRNPQTPPDLIIGPGLGPFLLSLREWLTPWLLWHTRETTL